jgi:hypothetical protein
MLHADGTLDSDVRSSCFVSRQAVCHVVGHGLKSIELLHRSCEVTVELCERSGRAS